MIKNLIVFILIFITNHSFSQQTVAFRDKIRMNKNEITCAAIECGFETDIAKNGVLQHLKAKGFNYKKASGFYIFKKTTIKEISPQTFDYYVAFSDVKGEQEKVKISTFITQPDSLTALQWQSNAELYSLIQKYIQTWDSVIYDYDLAMKIEKQADRVLNADRDYNRSIKDSSNLAQRKLDIEKEIAANKIDQANKLEQLNAAKEQLEALKKKRR